MTTLTLEYDRLEDRLSLWVRVPQTETAAASTQQLWLTRRLAAGILDLLVRLLQQTGENAAGEPGLSRLPQGLAQAWQEDRLALAHRQFLERIRQQQEQAALTERTEKLPAAAGADRDAGIAQAHLIDRLDAAWMPEQEAVQLAWHVGEVMICRFNLPRAELHWLLARLNQLAQQADWQTPLPLPAWLQDEGSAPALYSRTQPTTVLH